MVGPDENGAGVAGGRSEIVAGVISEVAPGVARVVAPNPGLMTGPGTNTYLLGDRDVVLVDPGPDDDAHFSTLLDIVGDRLRTIVVTHTHVDHSPLAGRLRTATGAQVLGFGVAPPPPPHGHGLDAHDQGFRPDGLLADGDTVEAGPLRLTAVHTPGHAANHLCFVLSGTGLLFSGDHVMSGSTVVVAPPDGDMGDYLASLERVRALAPERIAPGHGAMIDDAPAVVEHYLSHRMARQAQVLAVLRSAGEDGRSALELVPEIYRDVPEALHPVAKFSLWAHLRKLGDDGLVSCPDPADITAPWSRRRPSAQPAD